MNFVNVPNRLPTSYCPSLDIIDNKITLFNKEPIEIPTGQCKYFKYFLL